MAPPKGNEFWKARSSHGAVRKFKTAKQLEKACCDYFDWASANPLEEEKLFAYEGKVFPGTASKMRPFTLSGLSLFLGISQQSWRDWRNPGHDNYREDLAPVIAWAETVIWTQKFEGAAAGLLNANIISRDLGLADKSELSGPEGGAIPMKHVIERRVVRPGDVPSHPASGAAPETPGADDPAQ